MDGMSDFYRMLDALEEIRPDLARVAGGRWPKLSADLDALREKVRSGSLPPALASVRLVALVQPYPAVLELVSAFPVVLQPDAVLQLRHGAADAAPRPRFVNLVFEPRGPSGPVPRDAPLEPDRDYFLRLDIGHLRKDSIVARAKNDHFPAEHLPETTDGHWLDIAVTSVDFATDSLSKASLFLPSHGPSWTCPCDPNQAHSCYPYQRHPYVFLALRTPKAAGRAHARLTIWARGQASSSSGNPPPSSAAVRRPVRPTSSPAGRPRVAVDSRALHQGSGQEVRQEGGHALRGGGDAAAVASMPTGEFVLEGLGIRMQGHG